MMKHSQRNQNNKCEISLQYLKKEVTDEVYFCMQINIKVSTSWRYLVLWNWLGMSRVPKIGKWQYF